MISITVYFRFMTYSTFHKTNVRNEMQINGWKPNRFTCFARIHCAKLKKTSSCGNTQKNFRFKIILISLPLLHAESLRTGSFYYLLPSILQRSSFFLKLKMTFHREEVQSCTLIQIKINFNITAPPHTSAVLIKQMNAASINIDVHKMHD